MTEQERLRRELRAMAAVNRQLQAQHEEPPAVRQSRKTDVGAAWLEELVTMGESDAYLVRVANGAVFAIEGSRKRAVRSGILAAALEQVLGVPRDVSDRELDELTEAAPVELLEARRGVPFVVVGGKRYPTTGVPLPYPVGDLQASEFPEGDVINAAAANVSRRRFDEALTGQFQISRMRGVLARKGPIGTAKAIGRRLRARTKRAPAR